MVSNEQTGAAVVHPVPIFHGHLASNANTIRHEVGMEGLSVAWSTARGKF